MKSLAIDFTMVVFQKLLINILDPTKYAFFFKSNVLSLVFLRMDNKGYYYSATFQIITIVGFEYNWAIREP